MFTATATLLLLSLLLVFGLSTASGEDTGEEVAAAPTAEVVAEVVEKRTATSRTFELSSGQLETRVYQAPVNYRDSEGDWLPIDQELHQAADGSVTNGANSFDVQLPEDLDQAPAKVSVGDAWVSDMPIGIGVAPGDVSHGDASYEAAGGATEIQFSGLPTGVKENIVLADSSAPPTYHFRLDASPGVIPALADDGSVKFETVVVMPAPVMFDSAEVAAPADAISYGLEPASDGNSWTLTVTADPNWLAEPGRAWPVTIDPSKTVPTPYLDCMLASIDELSRCGTSGSTTLLNKAKYASSGTDEFVRSILRFDLSAIPTTASLSSATIGLYSAKSASNVTKVNMYDVNRSWTLPSWSYWEVGHGNGGGAFAWTTPGGEYGKYMPTPTSLTPAERSAGSGPGWWNFSSSDLTWLVQRWLDKAVVNNGVLLKFADETPRVCCIERRLEWESSAGTNKPYLSVQYIEPAAADRKLTSPTDGAKTAKRFLLTSAWEQPGVTGVTFQYKTDKGWTDIPGTQVIDQDNQSVSWPYGLLHPLTDRESRPLYWDATSITEGLAAKKVQIRAVLSGDFGAGGYTKAVSAEINRHLGGPKDATTGVGPGSVDLMTGNFTVSRTDLSISAFNSTLEFSRSFSSREAGVEANGVLGPGWKPASPVEAAGSPWSKVVLKEETIEEEEGSIAFKWAELIDSQGGVIPFEENASNQFDTPAEMSGYILYRLTSSEIAFTDPDGNRTVFSNNGSGSEYLPKSVAMTGGPGNKSRMIYDPVEGKLRLKKIIGPAAPGISCPDESSSTADGCRLLVFNYGPASPSGLTRLLSITYYGPGEGQWDVAQYSYDPNGRLAAAWDPRISPALKETYTYNATGQIATLTPPGQEPWTMSYGTLPGGTAVGRLTLVKRPTLVTSNPTAQTTIAYEVPLTKGAGGPYDMAGANVAEWGQEDLPTDATAIFPPDEVPVSPPSSWTRATVYYMDAEGQLVNVATPSGAGTTAPSITTTETDRFGNVSRELTAQNRLRAMAQGTAKAREDKSRELDTQFRYSKDGTELQEEFGPAHQVRLESGMTTRARAHRSILYDTNLLYLNGTKTPSPGETKPHMPTSETTGALLTSEEVVDKRSTQYVYNWTLRKQIEVIENPEDPEKPNERKSVTVYDKDTGLPTEMRQPSNASGGGSGTTKVVYYEEIKLPGIGECESEVRAGLPCKVEPAAQPGTAGQPQLPIKRFLSYNQLGQILEMSEAPPSGTTRTTVSKYDEAGRPISTQVTGGGAVVPKVETLYSTTLGLPTTQRFVCPGSEPGCDTQATTATYDALGRLSEYQDADGVTAKTTYDFLSRPTTVNDGKGTQTMKYDSVTGLLVEREDSAAGTFTASYDADGQLVKRGLPNGLTAQTTFDEAGAATGLTYTKASNCGTSCNWLDFAVERSINGQIVLENGTLGKDEYAYDKLGRLITARETPSGGTCTTRSYKYDKDSNREEMTTTAGLGGVCSSSGGTTQKYSYDSADRLLGEGLTYDDFGRITNLPASLAGGKALTTAYFSTDMVASQSQNGVTNTYQLHFFATFLNRRKFAADTGDAPRPADESSWRCGGYRCSQFGSHLAESDVPLRRVWESNGR